MHTAYSDVVNTACEYYNSDDADRFYTTIWGGEDIHIGIYASETESIFAASRGTVEHLAARLGDLPPNARVLDLGAGYGGAARYLAQRFSCRITTLNLSEVQNERNRVLNRACGLNYLIEVIEGNFESLPFEDQGFDVVWSQDALLHSGNREKVVAEAARVLKPNGTFVFTDPMQVDTCPEGVLQPILDRIHLASLASPQFYRTVAPRYGLEEVGFEDLTLQLTNHYWHVLAETVRREGELVLLVSQAYLDRMKQGLQHWIDGGQKGYLTWGIFQFRKTST